MEANLDNAPKIDWSPGTKEKKKSSSKLFLPEPSPPPRVIDDDEDDDFNISLKSLSKKKRPKRDELYMDDPASSVRSTVESLEDFINSLETESTPGKANEKTKDEPFPRFQSRKPDNFKKTHNTVR